jgi:TatD DNase family protein
VAEKVPLDRLLVETDAPYLTPHPYRGKRNEPAYVPLVLATMAEVLNQPVAEIAAITTANAYRLFPKLLPK